jgi:putative N6-adenine-specific DNA methylase
MQAVVHKAAAERLCSSRGVQRLPEYGDGAELRVYLEKDKASILVDLAGDPLFKRGYRSEGGTAPLRESTAAAIVLLSGWRRKYPLCDPFCGSGTILLEAAMYAWDAAPGMGRNFAISRLAIADQAMEASIRKELLERVDCSRTIRLFGSDADLRAVSIAESNARRAFELAHGQKPGRGIRLAPGGGAGGNADSSAGNNAGTADEEATLPRFKVQDAGTVMAPEPEGFIITNPPYGERLGDLQEAERTYQEMGSLGDRFPGWKLVVVTNHPGFESHFGYAADSVREITNGALRTFLYTYDQLGRNTDVHRSRA